MDPRCPNAPPPTHMQMPQPTQQYNLQLTVTYSLIQSHTHAQTRINTHTLAHMHAKIVDMGLSTDNPVEKAPSEEPSTSGAESRPQLQDTNTGPEERCGRHQPPPGTL
ncbi:Hypothetical predicted protein [Xyrichtys novacula]|uniref:Uncharacterized protein n=1 Tax=Xyrichtys novacula TaxID=13765 RepID=A0AAV1GDG0_XYRNO|nr:Hypothetical predicted protein [Xyrichtys novacula]